jgi:hypothetical protein
MYLIRQGELIEIADHFKRQSNPLIAKRMGGIISNISDRPHAPAPEQKPGCYITCPFDDLCANDIEKIQAIEAEAARAATLAENKRVLDEFTWMRPLCFGKHEAICDTRCAWVVRQHCVNSLRQQQEREQG